MIVNRFTTHVMHTSKQTDLVNGRFAFFVFPFARRRDKIEVSDSTDDTWQTFECAP